MNQYLIAGYDYTDDGALERRMEVRPLHLEAVKRMREIGNYLLGGAILDDKGRMIGSAMILQFESEEQLEVWKQEEPYITKDIWETVDIKQFKVAQLE